MLGLPIPGLPRGGPKPGMNMDELKNMVLEQGVKDDSAPYPPELQPEDQMQFQMETINPKAERILGMLNKDIPLANLRPWDREFVVKLITFGAEMDKDYGGVPFEENKFYRMAASRIVTSMGLDGFRSKMLVKQIIEQVKELSVEEKNRPKGGLFKM